MVLVQVLQTGARLNLKKKTSKSVWYQQYLKVPVTTTFPKLDHKSSINYNDGSSKKMKMKKMHPPKIFVSPSFGTNVGFVKNLSPLYPVFWKFHAPVLKVGLSPSNFFFICFKDSILRMMKNAFYFILKGLFVLKIFKFLSWLFTHVEKTAWLER